MIKVKLYGDLKDKAKDLDEKSGTIGLVNIDSEDVEQVIDILSELEIEKEDLSHIFLNHEYSSPKRKVNDGDNLALFPKDMALLYKWYFTPKD